MGSNGTISYVLAGNTQSFLTSPGMGQPVFVADFDGDHQDDILFFNPGDANWWFGRFNQAGTLSFTLVGNTAGFLTSPGTGQPIFVKHFTGDRRAELLFYNPGDQNWWLGRLSDESKLSFVFVGNTANFFTSPGGAQPTFIGKFLGDGRDNILFFNPGDQNWWLGAVDGIPSLNWTLVGNTAGFLTGPGGGQPTYVGDFDADGMSDLLFFNPGDQNWWCGSLTGSNGFVWNLVANTAGFLTSPGSGQPLYVDDFDGDGTDDLLFFNPSDANWWLGRLNVASKIEFSPAGNTAGFFSPGAGQPTFVGDFDGDGQKSLLFFNPGDTNWWIGSLPSPHQMAMFSGGSLSIPSIDAYSALASSFSLVVAIQPASAGTVVAGSAFELSVSSTGAISLTTYWAANGQTASYTFISGDIANLVGGSQCQIVSCQCPANAAPTLYLDGALMTGTTSSNLNAPARSTASLIIGNGLAGVTPYSGGIMYFSLWGDILLGDALVEAGQGAIVSIADPLLGYWPLGANFVDLSDFGNSATPTASGIGFMHCDRSKLAGGPGHASCHVHGYMNNAAIPVTSRTFQRTILVPSGCAILSAAVVDDSGYAAFPPGVVVTVTDPNGIVYNQDTNTAASFVQTQASGGATSLVAMLLNAPISAGAWTISITAPSNVAFRFYFTASSASSLSASAPSHDFLGLNFFEGVLAVTATIVAVAAIAVAAGLAAPAVLMASAAVGVVVLTVNALTAGITLVPEIHNEVSRETPPPPPVAHADWLSAISGNTSIGDLNLPGTHDSAAIASLLGMWKYPWNCQDRSITGQLIAGIRILDVRLQVVGPASSYTFMTCHGNLGLSVDIHVFQPFTSLLSECLNFLTAHAGEFIAMSLKIDDWNNLEGDKSGVYAALSSALSNGLGKLLYTTSSSAPTVPTLGDVRGNVYVFNRIDSSQSSLGVPLNIADNTDGAPANARGNYGVWAQDHYSYPALSSAVTPKYNAVVAAMQVKAGGGNNYPVVFNFASVDVRTPFVWLSLKDRLAGYFGVTANRTVSFGWIMFDYPFYNINTDEYGFLTIMDLIVASNSQFSQYPNGFKVIPLAVSPYP